MKAHVETKNGTKIVIEGAEDEISKVLEMFKEKHETHIRESSEKVESKKSNKSSNKLSAADLLLTLATDSFFNKPKTLAEIKHALEEQGYFYPITTLSGVVLGLVKKRNLRRIKENKVWGYVKV